MEHFSFTDHEMMCFTFDDLEALGNIATCNHRVT
jgi:hypothetical protein